MKPARAQLIAWGYPQDHKIGGLTIRCRGEMTPLRKRILAAQIADERKSINGYSGWNGRWYANQKSPAQQAEARYLAWCEKSGRRPILWSESQIIAEIDGKRAVVNDGPDGMSRLGKWLDKIGKPCRWVAKPLTVSEIQQAERHGQTRLVP